MIYTGVEARFPIQIIADDQDENDESLTLILGTPVNAVMGAISEQTITLTESNIAPEVEFQVTQGSPAEQTIVIARDNGPVQVTAITRNANGDGVTLEWSAETLNNLPGASADGAQLSFDPLDLAGPIATITATVMDDNVASLTTRGRLLLRLEDSSGLLADDINTDGDGILDSTERAADDDGDRIPNYIDNGTARNVMLIRDPDIDNQLPAYLENNVAQLSNALETQSGTTIALGELAFALASGNDYTAGLTQAQLQAASIEPDSAYTYPNDLIDFEVTGLVAGAAYRVMVPLEQPLTTGAVYRKYAGSELGWQNFVENASNQLWSALGTGGACPDIFSADYTGGLTIGDRCLMLMIEDGGPNDTDGLADGVLNDPGGIAIYESPDAGQSSVVFDRGSIVADGVDRVAVTVTVASISGVPLAGLTIVLADCDDCNGFSALPFTDRGNGIYESAVVRSGSAGGEPATLYFSVTDGANIIQLGPVELTVTSPHSPSGGCTVGDARSADSTLLLLLLLLLSILSIWRRRYRPPIVF